MPAMFDPPSATVEANVKPATNAETLLLVVRRCIGNQTVIEVAANLHPGEHFGYTMSLHLQPGPPSRER